VNAVAGAEDTIDAMDMRAFGTGKRTWLRHLQFDRQDGLVISFFALIFLAVTVAGFSGVTSHLWTPPFLIQLAGG
jgi:energy-coupling factor transport system permease protein